MSDKECVKNYYQGIYLTETIMGNPNGDFVDNSPRNFDGHVFTTDKCIKYNIRKYIHDVLEDLDKKQNIVFFFPRFSDNAKIGESKFKSRDQVYKDLFNKKFDDLLEKSVDVRMFGGTFSFQPSRQIYGPIQLSYGLDINNAEIKRLQVGSPFSTSGDTQTTYGSEAIVDDAIISYDITINPNNHPNLLLKDDLKLFKKALWYGTNSRRSTSKKTESKLLILIKFKNKSENRTDVISIGELKELIEISNKESHKLGDSIICLDCKKLNQKLKRYNNFIESIEFYYDSDEIIIDNFELKFEHFNPEKLLGNENELF